LNPLTCRFRAVIFLSPLMALLFGCGHPGKLSEDQAMRVQRDAQDAYFQDPDVGRRIMQKAMARHPELTARLDASTEGGGKVNGPRIIKTFAPIYPLGRQMNKAQGGVWISFIVGIQGSTEAVEWELDENALTHPSFVESARAAVRKWKFEPATIDGQPSPYMLVVPILFQLP
jgi:TonB family protein